MFARYKEAYQGCVNHVEANLVYSDTNVIIAKSETVRFTAHEALEARRLQAGLTVGTAALLCRRDLPELLHLHRGGHELGMGQASSLQAIELGVAAGKFSQMLLESRHIAHLYSVDSWEDEQSDHFIDEYFAVVQMFRRYGERSTVLRLTFEHALSFFADGSLDLVYIDGYAHTGQEGGSTIEDWYRKVAPAGMLAGHDYDVSRWPLTYHNVNLFANRHNLTVIVVGACEDDFSSWAILLPDEEELEARKLLL